MYQGRTAAQGGLCFGMFMTMKVLLERLKHMVVKKRND
jgi:hypothetical protein